MDKSWIDLPDRLSSAYIKGFDDFLEFAYTNKDEGSSINCPCRKCVNRYYFSRRVVRKHLLQHGFLKKYKNWTNHGEPYEPLHGQHESEDMGISYIADDMVGMIHEAMGIPNVNTSGENDEANENEPHLGPNEQTLKFLKLLEGAQSPLYPGCQSFTVLSFVVRLLHIKVLNGWTDKSFTDILELLKIAFPKGVQIPSSYYEAQKLTEDLGFTYKTWDACPDSCMLFRNEDMKLDRCVICNKSRWKDSDSISNDVVGSGKKIATKQVRYFPLKPRLQRLFVSSKRAKLMRWHADERTNDGVFRHPADSLAWTDFDQRHPIFASEIRNVRLGLASDGFNPFRTMNIAHSTWPVVLIPYNLPPWLCMKQPSLILSLLIDGPKGPGDKIDVYMQPLIEELKELWEEGIQTFDASSNQMFQMHAALLWTINDFPAYANLSGWSTKGEFACPCCSSKTKSFRLKHGNKFTYIGHRRFLPRGHKLRKDKVSFDGKQEWELQPKTMSGVDALAELEKESILTEYKRYDLLKRKRIQSEKGNNKAKKHNWKKKSIFFELPYWKHNLVRHNLDVMHIEKNFCDNLLWTILGVAGKTKDNLNARRDLRLMKIRAPLHLQARGSNKEYLPPAQFSMSKDEKDRFLKVLKEVRVPDGYASNISRHVRLHDRSIWGLKSHDNHILMQQLMPLAIRKSLPRKVVETLIELSNFFRKLCSKGNCAADLEDIQARFVITLCHLEKIFPPSFFDIMEHLPVHLAEEALKAGPVQFRWMYPIERYLLTLKQYVRNRARPEGSMAKGYLMEECMTFCTQYLHDVETKYSRPVRNDDGGEETGHSTTNGKRIILDNMTWVQVHRYVLFNTDSTTPFRNHHVEILKSQFPRADEHQIQRVHFEKFHEWFMEHVQMSQMTTIRFSEDIIRLAAGPQTLARSFKSYNVNGTRFRIKNVDVRRATQNSGVAIKADTMCVSSRKDKNPHVGAVYYYGKLTDIIKISYSNDLKYVLFKCDWIDNNVGKKEDVFKFTLVNFNHLLYRVARLANEPFILASQAEQVWYVLDPEEPNWLTVVKMCPRGLFESTDAQAEPYVLQQLDENVNTRDAQVGWVREGIEGETLDSNIVDGLDDEMEE